MKEGQIQAGVTRYLRGEKIPYVKMTGFGSRGWPDITCCINGRMVCFEMKAAGKKPTAKQGFVGRGIILSGGYWFSYDSVRDCVDAVEYFMSLPYSRDSTDGLKKTLGAQDVTKIT